MSMFKAPDIVPQDLQVIQDILAAYAPPNKEVLQPEKPKVEEVDDDVASSCGSEAEIEAMVKEEKDMTILVAPADIPDSDTDSSESEDDSDNESSGPEAKLHVKEEDIDDDELGPASTSQNYHGTVNEIVDPTVSIPPMEEVGEDEVLEKVGEVMTIIERTVIVKGLAIGGIRRGPSRALDADTLLVFGDRKVLGYVHEIFGPTTEPMYQVRFQSVQQVDREKIQLAREVFHMPRCSNFVFVSDTKGSDASNWNDEETADAEQEFSDDEAEAAFKRNLKQQRRSRSQSVASSRRGSPTPNYSYDPYDDDFAAAGPSRPIPMSYDDDPYSDTFMGAPAEETPGPPPVSQVAPGQRPPRLSATRGRGGGRGAAPARGRGGDRRSQGRGRPPGNTQQAPMPGHEPYNPLHSSYDMGGFAPPPQPMQYTNVPPLPPQSWGQPPPPWPPQHAVMPHFNPRFAPAFSMPTGFPYPNPPAPSGMSFPGGQQSMYPGNPGAPGQNFPPQHGQ